MNTTVVKRRNRNPIASEEVSTAPQRAAPEKAQTYSSPAIRARRRRILDETRKMIAEQGLVNFNMNDLCKRAGVAKRTLYNAFQTKERTIAIAINEYFQEYVDKIPYSAPAGTLQRNMERLISVSQRNVRIRNYIRAIMSIYFSAEVNPDIWHTMHSMATRPTLEWLENLRAAGQLQPWVEVDQLADDLVRYEYATINDWSHGRMADDELTPRLLLGFLTFIAGATRDAAHLEVLQAVRQIKENGVPSVRAVAKTAKAAKAAKGAGG